MYNMYVMYVHVHVHTRWSYFKIKGNETSELCNHRYESIIMVNLVHIATEQRVFEVYDKSRLVSSNIQSPPPPPLVMLTHTCIQMQYSVSILH